MAHKDLEDLMFFSFEKRVEGTIEVIGFNGIFEQMTRRKVIFSKSQHYFRGTDEKALLTYFTIASIIILSIIITISITTITTRS